MATLRVVTEPALATGFRLAGLPVEEAGSPRDLTAAIERLTREHDAGVILVQQDLWDDLPEADRRAIERTPVPIVVPVPPPRWTARGRGAEEYILDLLQRAIGYRVRLQ